VDDFTDSSGNQVAFEDAESVLARVGLSANKWFTNSHGSGSYFGLINLYHEFDPDTRVSVGGMNFDEEIDDTAIELGFGARMILNDRYELSGSLNYLTGLEDLGESYELEAVLGLQVRF
jgi:outer membrane autotransporter protein